MQSSRQCARLARATSFADKVVQFSLPSSYARRLRRSTDSLHLEQNKTWRRATSYQRSPRTAKRAAAMSRKAVDTRSVMTRAAMLDAPRFGESDIWQWRKAQLHKIAMFTGPALSIPLADPIMSLVDTVCVGQVWV